MSDLFLKATFALFIGFGALIMLVNIPMIVYIYTHHHLRKQKEVILIGFVCIADLLNAIAFFFAGQHRLNLVQSELMGILYITLGFWICVYSWENGPEIEVPAMCYTSSAYGPQVWNYILFFRQCSITASIIMYLPISIRVFYLKKRVRCHCFISTTGASPHRRLIKTTTLIGVTLLCEIVFIVIPDLFLNFNLFGLKKYEMIWYLIVLSKGIVNIFLYSFNHGEIKSAILWQFPARGVMRRRNVHAFETG